MQMQDLDWPSVNPPTTRGGSFFQEWRIAAGNASQHEPYGLPAFSAAFFCASFLSRPRVAGRGVASPFAMICEKSCGGHSFFVRLPCGMAATTIFPIKPFETVRPNGSGSPLMCSSVGLPPKKYIVF